MFIMITIYTCTHGSPIFALMLTPSTVINLYRGIRAFALLATPPMPVMYYHDFTNWDNYAFAVIVTLLVWHADALVVSPTFFLSLPIPPDALQIYRCFIIWGHNLWAITLPIALLLLSFGAPCTHKCGTTANNDLASCELRHPDGFQEPGYCL